VPSNVADQIQSTEESTEENREEGLSAPDDGAAPRKLSDQQQAVEAAFCLVTGEAFPAKQPGYSGVAKLVAEHGIPALEEWAKAHNGRGVPDGANSWEWFKRAARDGLKRPWEWKPKVDAQAADSIEPDANLAAWQQACEEYPEGAEEWTTITKYRPSTRMDLEERYLGSPGLESYRRLLGALEAGRTSGSRSATTSQPSGN